MRAARKNLKLETWNLKPSLIEASEFGCRTQSARRHSALCNPHFSPARLLTTPSNASNPSNPLIQQTTSKWH